MFAGWLLSCCCLLGASSASEISFDHLKHHKVACERCHPGVGEQVRPQAFRSPGHAACRPCHQTLDAKSTQTACEQCHLHEPRSRQDKPWPLRFSHLVHSSRDIACVACHDANQSKPQATYEHCESCHEKNLSGNCRACHPSLASGRLRLQFEQGKLRPRGGHGGEDHSLGWDTRHGSVARLADEKCRVCHAQTDCTRCHQGVNRPLRIHAGDWELTHASVARLDATSCQRCHRSASDCLRCHQQASLEPSTQPQPINRRVHPAGFDISHASQARRNLHSCTGCHKEADCIRCHGSAGYGQRVSPHSVGFRSSCSLMRKRNQRPCLKCHQRPELDWLCP